ncbi:MAG: LolA family protein [Elusimicrobiota bacterium]
MTPRHRAVNLLAAAAAAMAFSPGPALTHKSFDPVSLIFSAPKSFYTGRVRFSHRYGGKKTETEAQIFFAPPNRYLEEFLDPDGKTRRLAISDGRYVETYAIRAGKITGRMISQAGSAPDPGTRALFSRNYRVAVRRGRMDGRSAWVIRVRPRIKGKPWQIFSIDQKTGAILSNTRYLPGTAYLSSLNFLQFDPKKYLSGSLFRVNAPAGRGDWSLRKTSGPNSEPAGRARTAFLPFPRMLADGFVLDGVRGFRIRGSIAVRQARYTDGLAAVSAFETDRPVAIPGGDGWNPASAAPSDFAAANFSAGSALEFRRAGRHYLLLSDVSGHMLSRLAVFFR